jgi:ribosomal protein S18 acetylase RimI-like enzyme
LVWEVERRQRLTDRESTDFRDLLEACNAAEAIDLPFFFPEIAAASADDEYVLVRERGQLVGFGHLPSDEEPEGCLMVHPARRHQGIGTVILNAFRDEISRRGLGRCLLVADQASPSGAAFLAARGVPHESSEFRLEWRSGHGSEPVAAIADLDMRRAHGSDAAVLVDLMSRSFDRDVDDVRDRIAEGLNETKRHFYVARLAGEPVGLLRAGEVDGAGDITAFGVLPEHRGKGFGRRMLTEAVRLLANQGFERVLIEVATDNANALGLYQSCGFRIISEYGFYALSPLADDDA